MIDLTQVRSLILLFILLGTCVLAFFIRLFAIIKFESIIHEFDPWFNYRATEKMVTMGFCLPSKKMSNAFFGFNNFETSTIQQTSFTQHFILHIEITDTIMPDPVWPDMYDAGSNESETLVIKVEPNSIWYFCFVLLPFIALCLLILPSFTFLVWLYFLLSFVRLFVPKIPKNKKICA